MVRWMYAGDYELLAYFGIEVASLFYERAPNAIATAQAVSAVFRRPPLEGGWNHVKTSPMLVGRIAAAREAAVKQSVKPVLPPAARQVPAIESATATPLAQAPKESVPESLLKDPETELILPTKSLAKVEISDYLNFLNTMERRRARQPPSIK